MFAFKSPRRLIFGFEMESFAQKGVSSNRPMVHRGLFHLSCGFLWFSRVLGLGTDLSKNKTSRRQHSFKTLRQSAPGVSASGCQFGRTEPARL